jgi:formylglycine-generating enzyme required for sulfatase activity
MHPSRRLLHGHCLGLGAPRLPSVEPRADAWFSPCGTSADRRDPQVVPQPQALRHFLAQTLEITLDLLQGADDTDEALHVFRLALLHEDRLAERLAVAAQWRGVAFAALPDPPRPLARAVERPPVWLPAGVAVLGSAPGGLVPPQERWAHEVRVPECEIDAQPVSWARFAEFVDDGGYDESRWWSSEGWQWSQACGRRSPRGVVQWRGGVCVERSGQVRRATPWQPAAHVSEYEAQAWCAWAGRRLPTEAEWSRAQVSAARTGFVWGEVWEWVWGAARPWSTAQAQSPVAGFSAPRADPPQRVLRGASDWTVPRAAHPQVRRFADPARDDLLCGFRSCAA